MNPITYNTVILILFANTAYFSLFAVAGGPTPRSEKPEEKEKEEEEKAEKPEEKEKPEKEKPEEKQIIIDIANLNTTEPSGYKRTTVAHEDVIVPEDGYVITKVVDNNVDIFTAGNNKIVRIYIPKLITNKIIDIVLSDTKHCCFEKQNNAYVEVSLFEILRNREKTEKYTLKLTNTTFPHSILSLKCFCLYDKKCTTIPLSAVVEKIVYDDEVIMDNTNFYLIGAATYNKDKTSLIHVCFITKDNKRGEKYFMRKLEEKSFSEVSIEEGINFLRTINSSIPEDYEPESNGFMTVALYFMLAVSTALFVF